MMLMIMMRGSIYFVLRAIEAFTMAAKFCKFTPILVRKAFSISSDKKDRCDHLEYPLSVFLLLNAKNTPMLPAFAA